MNHSKIRRLLLCSLLGAFASTGVISKTHAQTAPIPDWLPPAIIYSVYPEIFSEAGNLAGVTAQLPRLQKLGVTVLWIMPVTPVGQPFEGRPAFNSPYCVRDYYGIDPRYGTGDDLKQLVRAAHRHGIKVILDAVLNHTAWENPMLRQHPEYYKHTDADPKNVASIQQAFTYADVAQLDYNNPELRQYITRMLGWWVSEYDIDGFRFDAASNPPSANRMIPASFWKSLPATLQKIKPDLLLLGECLDPELARAPFSLDYGWNVGDGLKRAAGGESADAVRAAWLRQTDNYPPGMLHLSLQDTWDAPDRDVRLYGGPSGAMAAAVFNLTINGIPLLYNGMEVGNDAGTINPHQKINWKSPYRQFPAFYRDLIALRKRYPALQQGTMTWLPNSAPDQVLSYTRSGGGGEFLILINLSNRPVKGSMSASVGAGWFEVTPSGSPGGRKHTYSPEFSLLPHDFAILRRVLPSKSTSRRK
ncbi:MAG: DUF3459 domain-containing protein [Fibrella sp.]|nr:DUF3459 domain-containing protein [Armatimonadota bacterium]